MSLGLMLADGWHMTFPTTQDLTFHQGSSTNAVLSRLDQIYTTPNIFETAREWKISETPVKTDHSLVSVGLMNDQAPEMGKGQLLFY